MRPAIERAAGRISTRVRRTPVMDAELDGLRLALKLELLQHTGSFKPRGAFNRILASKVPEAGVIAASGGNHGLAVAYAASQLGTPAEIFVPTVTPEVKVQRLSDYGAQVTVTGEFYADALEASHERGEATGALVVHAYDQPEVVAGQGTVGMELMEQVPDVDTILVAVGGAGLIGGISAWASGTVRVIGVEPRSAPTLARALELGEPVDVEVNGIAADSLGARRVGSLAFEQCQKFVERVLLVSDEAIRRSQALLWKSLHLVVEPGGATALAAILDRLYTPGPEERVAVVVCGSNADPGRFSGG